MGGGIRSYEFAKKATRCGHEVHMLALYENYTNRKSWFIENVEGIKVHWLPIKYSNNMHFYERLRVFIIFAIKAFFRCFKLKADLIYATSTPLTVAIPAIGISKIKKIPYIFEVRDLWPDIPIALGFIKNPFIKFLSKQIEKYAYKWAAAIVVLSPDMKDEIIKKGFIKSTKIATIPNMSNISNFKIKEERLKKFLIDRPYLNGDPVLIYTGTIGLVNDISYLVNLCYELKKIKSKIKTLVIGDGSEFYKIKSYANELGVLNNNFFLESKMSKIDIITAINAATMGISTTKCVPELFQNSANKFFDYLASGKPVIINHGGWLENVVNKYKCGFTTYGMNLETASKILNKKANDKDWLENASNSSYKLASSYFGSENLKKNFIDVIHLVKDNKYSNIESIAPGKFI